VQHPLQISARDLALSPVARALVERLAGKLETFYDRITSCHVVIEVAQRYPAGGPIAYNVRLDLAVPGEEIVVRRHPHRELETAIQNAFDVAGRRLQDYVRRRHAVGEGREQTPEGEVVRLFPYEGYGFIRAPDGREVYFHKHSVLDEAFDRLEVGTRVRYAEEAGEAGPQASSVAVRAGERRVAKGGSHAERP
jgi:cold shock CspA family protein/ribosome-associated translation inhibitor RaiA